MHPPYAALADKYRLLAALRRAHAHDGALATRDTLRTLARDFPGALRELDAMPLAALDARAAELTAVAAGEAVVVPWMDWCAGYHALMRAALAIKRAIGRGIPTEALAERIALAATETAGMTLDADFVRSVAHPPGGRLNPVVLARLGTHCGVDPDTVWNCLFPTRRAAPRSEKLPPQTAVVGATGEAQTPPPPGAPHTGGAS